MNNLILIERIMGIEVTARLLYADVNDFVSPDNGRLNSILAQLPIPRRVLELGCGNRPVVAAPNAFHVAIDQDGYALQTAMQSVVQTVQTPFAGRILLVQAAIEDLPFSARFDLILTRHPDVDRHPDTLRQAPTPRSP